MDQFPFCNVSNLQITLKSFKYTPQGEIIVKLVVSYNGEKFLGIHIKKAKIITPEGKSVVNVNQESGSLYYRKQRSHQNITLEFANPNGLSQQLKGDQLVLEDVFCEYESSADLTPFEFNFIKTSEGRGKIPEEEKEKRKEIEVIED